MDAVIEKLNPQVLIRVSASTPLGTRQGDLRLVLDDKKNIELVSFRPDMFKKDKYKSVRRIFSPSYLKELKQGQYEPLFRTDTPDNEWISIAKSSLDPAKGGKVVIKIKNPGDGNGSIHLTIATPKGNVSE